MFLFECDGDNRELHRVDRRQRQRCIKDSLGTVIAKRALEKGINTVVFDRGGFIYQGKIAALAEAAREAGLEF